MREIKFRSWDKTDKKMTTTEFIMDSNGGRPAKNVEEWGRVFVLMQYTGLKDKNGKEVYEGDIVMYKHEDDTVLFHAVTWLNAGEFSLEELWAGGVDWHIVGSIYENPELL